MNDIAGELWAKVVEPNLEMTVVVSLDCLVHVYTRASVQYTCMFSSSIGRLGIARRSVVRDGSARPGLRAMTRTRIRIMINTTRLRASIRQL